jgi:L-iditol 2-dehydrogenase
MNSLRLHGRNDLRLHDEPMPTAKPGESLLRITAVGICGSDLHWFDEGGIGDAQLEMPLVLGHEFAAVVVSSGQRVAVEPAVACETCEFCLEGNPNLCINHYFSGSGGSGGCALTGDALFCPGRLQ